VVLIDKAGPGEGTSHGNGGILASCSVVPVVVPGLMRQAPGMLLSPNQPLFVKWGYLPRMLPWLMKYLSHANARDARRISTALHGIIGDSLADHQALAAGTGAEKWIVPGYYMYCYKDRAAFKGDAFGWGLRREAGFEWDELEGADFHAAEPALSDALNFGVRMADHGRISDPGQYVKDLAAAVEAGGGRVITASVDDIVREGGAVTGLRAGGETIACDAAVIATGVWSGPLCAKLGLKVPLESERGYHMEFWQPSVMPTGPLMIAGGKFVITPMEGRLRAAGVVEFGGLDAPPSAAPFRLLKRNLMAAMPGLTYSEITEWQGHRPAPSDSIPVIGEIPGAKGVFTGFGHHHIGLTGGPKTGRLLAQLIAGRQPNIDLTPYSPARFAGRVS
jgi:D-amino-acid dehydrogenase